MTFSFLSKNDYKKKILLLLFFIFSVMTFYFLVLNKFFYIIEIKEKIENVDNKILNLQNEKKRLSKKSSVLENDIKIAKKKEEKSLKGIQKGFSNINSLEIFIEKYLRESYLRLNIIGRGEIDDNSSKIYLPYEIEGKTNNLLSFLKKLESLDRDISFGETPFIIKFGEIAVYQGKIKSSIVMYNENENFDIRSFDLYKNNDETISQIRLFSFNKKKYVIIQYLQGERRIFVENQLIELGNKKYRLKINAEKISLEAVCGD